MQPIILLIALVAAVQFATSQTTFSIGTAGTIGGSSYSTSMYKVDSDCACGFYANGEGNSQSVGIEAYVRSTVAPITRLVGFIGISNSRSNSTWIEPGDSLPYIDSTNGQVLFTNLEHKLSYDTRGRSISAGLGLEYGIVSLTPIVRVTHVTTASTVNRMSFVSPGAGVFKEQPNVEYEDNGRTIVYLRVPNTDHTSVLVDAGAMVGVSLETDIWGVRFVGSAQAYFLAGINNIHIAYPTKMNYEYGARLFAGIGL
jgi:hypothetical protein